MTESNDSQNGDDFWSKDYEPSERTKKALEPEPNTITKTAKLTYDGEQFYVRFPKEIAESIGIDKDMEVQFTATEHPPETGEENELEIELVKPEE